MLGLSGLRARSQTVTFVPPEDKAGREAVGKWTVGFCRALQAHLQVRPGAAHLKQRRPWLDRHRTWHATSGQALGCAAGRDRAAACGPAAQEDADLRAELQKAQPRWSAEEIEILISAQHRWGSPAAGRGQAEAGGCVVRGEWPAALTLRRSARARGGRPIKAISMLSELTKQLNITQFQALQMQEQVGRAAGAGAQAAAQRGKWQLVLRHMAAVADAPAHPPAASATPPQVTFFYDAVSAAVRGAGARRLAAWQHEPAAAAPPATPSQQAPLCPRPLPQPTPRHPTPRRSHRVPYLRTPRRPSPCHPQLGGCERLLRTPIPVSYTRHTARFLTIWLALLPAGLWERYHFSMLPVIALIGFLLLGIDEIGVTIEEPFAILPLDAICTRAQTDVVRPRPRPGPACPAATAFCSARPRSAEPAARPRQGRARPVNARPPGVAAALSDAPALSSLPFTPPLPCPRCPS